MSISISVYEYKKNGETFKNWNCFYFLQNNNEKTIELDFTPKSDLIKLGGINRQGTVCADYEESEYTDSIEIDLESVFLMDYENDDAKRYKLSDDEYDSFKAYILDNYDFTDSRIEAYEDYLEEEV